MVYRTKAGLPTSGVSDILFPTLIKATVRTASAHLSPLQYHNAVPPLFHNQGAPNYPKQEHVRIKD